MSYTQRAVDLFKKTSDTLTNDDVWLAKRGHLGQAQSLIANNGLSKFGSHVVTHGIGAGYDYTVNAKRGNLQRDHHRAQFEQHTTIDKAYLYCPNTLGLHGDQIDDTTMIPTLAYRLGYHADQILKLPCDKKVVVEIGGGWGLLGHILTNAQPGLCYIAVDLPSCLMLVAYFIMSTGKKTVCFGEYDDLATAITENDCVCIPPSEIKNIPNMSVDVVFNANSFPEMTTKVIRQYIGCVRRVCKSYFYYDNLINSDFPNEVGGAHRLQNTCDDMLQYTFDLIWQRKPPIHTDIPWIGNPAQERREYQEKLYGRKIINE